MTEPEPPVLTPVIIEPNQARLLPAIREDLAPFVPALRGAAQLLAVAAVAEFAAHYAAPALLDATRQLVATSRPPKQTILVEETTTVRRQITVT